MALTASSALSSAITFKVQRQVLQNLRGTLVWADPAYSQQGDFDAGHDVITFVTLPDMSVATTALTEGTAPTAVALTITTVTVSASQYGNLISITDLAKVKSPIDIVGTASERLSFNARLTIDQITRDSIAASGTAYFQGTATTRAGLGAGNVLVANDLRKLRGKMYGNKIPRFPDGMYRIFVHPNVAYDLRNDSATGSWEDVRKYTDANAGNVIRGEVGSMEGFRVIEVWNAPTFASTVTVYGSIAVGGINGWGAGDLQTLQTYHVPAGGDHSDPIAQQELVGWKVAFGVAALNNSYYFRLESAATAL